MIEKLMLKLGYVPLPKAGEGQIVVGPVVRKLPVRKSKIGVGDLPPAAQALCDAIENAGGEVHITEIRANLCDICKADFKDCLKAVKETDQVHNTVKCTEYK
ncbi:MAG: hypothetical protein PHI12_08680 [Dehalococcoidales bacterium]|nr:hypothetical protein [Dehalococcoidales bacterium]